MDYQRIVIATLVMAGITYAIRMLPMVLFRKKITNRFVQSFLYYMPYAVLGAMTFPEILYATGSMVAGAIGLVVALFMAWKGKGLLPVAIAATAAAYLTEQMFWFFR